MQPDENKESAAAPAPGRSVLEELRAFGESIPHKGWFAVLLLGWLALFHFYGNSTLGYVKTPSIFAWLRNCYSHTTDDGVGKFILPGVLLLLWWKRAALASAPKRWWWPAAGLFLAGVLLHVAGYRLQQARVSVVGLFVGLYGIMGWMWGPALLRALFFPYFLFAFTMPLTGELEGMTLPLRLLATKITVLISHAGGFDVMQKGTLIESGGGHFSYNVEAACSGLRSLTTMLMLGCVFGFTAFESNWKRAVLIASAVPLAICGNVVRLMSIVVSASWKYDQMIALKQPLAVARAAAQEFGSATHDHFMISLASYLPAFVGMMLLARWLREDGARAGDVQARGEVRWSRMWATGAAVLLVTAATAGFLATQHSRQKLGVPGVRVENRPMFTFEAGASTNAPRQISDHRVHLPANVLDFLSQEYPISQLVWDTLPKDTVFGHRLYGRTNGLALDMQVVLMGADRSSLHKPDYCLPGNGFKITRQEEKEIRVRGPQPHDLPVMKLTLARTVHDGENARQEAGVYVYWFVADGQVTAQHWQRMWWMARDQLRTGVLQRWAYVICYAPCAPGAEEETYARLTEFIAAAVPEIHTGPPARLARAEQP